jgi:hypothetical protein
LSYGHIAATFSLAFDSPLHIPTGIVLRRLLTYGFPFFLLGLEAVIRSALGTDTKLFIGPAIAAAAAVLLVPQMSVEDKILQLPPEVQEVLRRSGATAVGKWDKRLAEFIPLVLFTCIGLWGWIIVLAVRKDQMLILGYQRPLFISMCTYVGAVVIAETKEFV